MDWRTLGASVVVSARGRPDVRGWLWRETPDGIYVALDKEAKEIRFVRSGGLNIGYQYEDMAPWAVPDRQALIQRIYDLNSKLSDPMEYAVDALNHALLRRTVSRAKRAMWHIEHSPVLLDTQYGAEPIQPFHQARIDEAIDNYKAVHSEFDRVGLLDLVSRHLVELSNLPPEHSLPMLDAEIMRRLPSLGETADHWDKRSLDVALRDVDESRIRFIVVNSAPASEEKVETTEGETAGLLPHWIGASLNLFGGTALAAANGLIGISVGVVGALATQGMTAVPTAVGVATSVGTGIGYAADGLEKIRGLLTHNQERASSDYQNTHRGKQKCADAAAPGARRSISTNRVRHDGSPTSPRRGSR
jgi:hypothetical protein